MYFHLKTKIFILNELKDHSSMLHLTTLYLSKNINKKIS